MASFTGHHSSTSNNYSFSDLSIKNGEISQSWERCANRYKIDPSHSGVPPRLHDSEVKEDKEEFEELFFETAPLLHQLRLTALDAGYCILVTNKRGTVLQSYLDSSVSRELELAGLMSGSIWSESIVGTNGVGTCLETGKSLTVYANEHFGESFKHLTCSAAPLIAPDGSIFGALDVSSFAQGNKLVQGFALNLVCETADKIEALIFKKTYSQTCLIEVSKDVMLKGDGGTCLIALDNSGVIIAITTPTLKLMGIRKRELVIGLPLYALFGLSIDQVIESNGAPLQVCSSQDNSQIWFTHLTAKQRPTRNTRLEGSAARPSALNMNTAPIVDMNSPLMRIAGSDEKLKYKAAICLRTVNKGINILLQGETGTGKEVWARAIHESSARKDKPFVTLNCAAIPESLIESELFGYTAGTFTGGLKGGKEGKIQASNGGTLFLDEIGDMPLSLQARLLRVLAESEITPLGQTTPVKIDLHVICATHQNLVAHVEEKKFREDLYYRINGVNIILPSLRNRTDHKDVFDRVLKQLCDEEGLDQSVSISLRTINVLENYTWPGNIRQLKSVLKFALCMSNGCEIDIHNLPEELFLLDKNNIEHNSVLPSRVASLSHELSYCSPADASEKDIIEKALEENRWVVTKAAKALDISRSTLHRKLKKYGLALLDERN